MTLEFEKIFELLTKLSIVEARIDEGSKCYWTTFAKEKELQIECRLLFTEDKCVIREIILRKDNGNKYYDTFYIVPVPEKHYLEFDWFVVSKAKKFVKETFDDFYFCKRTLPEINIDPGMVEKTL